MQTATVTVNLSPETSHVKHGITPAEALILRKLFFKSSQGSPLIHLEVSGDAQTEGRARTNAEEIARLKMKYTGIIDGKRAFEAVFGTNSLLRLPQTFEEVAEDLGENIFAAKPQIPTAEINPDAHDWLPEMEAELQDLQTTPRKTAEQKQRLADLLKYKSTAANVK